MKKFVLALIAACIVTSAIAGVPRHVQGRPYEKPGLTPADYDPNPRPIPAEKDFSFSEIKSWAGEGENECAVIIQWTVPSEDNALVFGYRWDGDATSEDALKAIIESHPRLYGGFTEGGAYGSTLDGLGWDPAGDGEFSVTTKSGTIVYPDKAGFLSGSAAGFDGATATKSDDWFRGGWYDGYWSFWIGKQGDSTLGYSLTGISGRNLEDGCIDAWVFAPNLDRTELKPWLAAPIENQVITPTIFNVGTLYYKIKSPGEVEVISPKIADGINKAYSEKSVVIDSEVTWNGSTYMVTSIGQDAFLNARTVDLTLPATVKNLESGALNCELEHLTILATIPPVCTSASFHKYASLDWAITVPEEAFSSYMASPVWKDFAINLVEDFYSEGIFYHVISEEECKVEVSKPFEFENIPGEDYSGAVIIPGKVVFKGREYDVTAIGDNAFNGIYSKATNITLPSTIKNIGRYAFNSSDLATLIVNCDEPPVCGRYTFGSTPSDKLKVFVPEASIEAYKNSEPWSELHINDVNIGDEIDHNGVKYVVLSNEDTSEVKVIQPYAARYSGTISIPESFVLGGVQYNVVEIDDYAFYLAKELTNVSIPSTVRKIGKYAFDGSSIIDIYIPDGIEQIETYAFYNCQNLEKVSGMKNVKEIGRAAFMMCGKLSSIESLENLEVLRGFAFNSDSSITELPDMPKLKKIESECLSDCNSLKYLVLPASIEAKGVGVIFGNSNNSGVKVFYCGGTPIDLGSVNSFSISYDPEAESEETRRTFAPVYVPYGKSELFNADWNWKTYNCSELTPEGVLTDSNVEVSGNKANFTAKIDIDGIVETDIPESFLAANDFSDFPMKVAASMKLEYRRVSSERNSENDIYTAGVTAKDKVIIANISNALPGNYEYRWYCGEPQNRLATDWNTFAIEKSGEEDPTSACFNFEDVATLNPAPSETDFIDEYSRIIWLCAGTEFENNGATMSFTNGPGLAYRSLIIRDAGNNTRLNFYGSLYLSAPAGKTLSSVEIISDYSPIFQKYLAEIELQEFQPGQLIYDAASAPDRIIWTPQEGEKVPSIILHNKTEKKAVYITKINLNFKDENTLTSVGEISTDPVEIEYYNLQGLRVLHPSKGLYIERKGAEMKKVMIK
ncbi:MAG: leucine-rich repeat domain-containing protein [Muribaculaceae bacterium]|nr:leucine-rich repeat domain-containing protein [Muribaculaceae bacterium]